MKDTLETLFETVGTLVIILVVGYILLSVGVYAAHAEEPLTYEEQVVALTILGEARGEKQVGMYGVACVIQNRADKRGLKLSQVCREDWQFSVWNKGKTVNDLKYLFNSPSAPYAIKLARAMCKGHKLVQAFTNHADHYCTLNTHNKWTRKAKAIKVIGNHKFFKLN